ncbi:flagellar protein [Geomicrobium sp. JCM 19037]|uniref:TIGR03826 family flagellar region protein n=1 Tax=unclassified Geomicrobium TaxID=2628951 RepID=UPI00045F1FC1|nr:TIGR03826 family flagellar region protein [Geomicrobium sp. JCM 19037]GAK02590.1 flagellar protein [Geomicrobium sp. JCM 19037]
MAELMNCKSCGNLYVKTIRDVCDSCWGEAEKRFERVYQFVKKKENRKATIQETSDHTDVTESEILDYVRTGRIQLTDLPGFNWPCHFCGKPTRSGQLCPACEKRLSEDLHESMSPVEGSGQRAYWVKNEHHERRKS